MAGKVRVHGMSKDNANPAVQPTPIPQSAACPSVTPISAAYGQPTDSPHIVAENCKRSRRDGGHEIAPTSGTAGFSAVLAAMCSDQRYSVARCDDVADGRPWMNMNVAMTSEQEEERLCEGMDGYDEPLVIFSESDEFSEKGTSAVETVPRTSDYLCQRQGEKTDSYRMGDGESEDISGLFVDGIKQERDEFSGSLQYDTWRQTDKRLSSGGVDEREYGTFDLSRDLQKAVGVVMSHLTKERRGMVLNIEKFERQVCDEGERKAVDTLVEKDRSHLMSTKQGNRRKTRQGRKLPVQQPGIDKACKEDRNSSCAESRTLSKKGRVGEESICHRKLRGAGRIKTNTLSDEALLQEIDNEKDPRIARLKKLLSPVPVNDASRWKRQKREQATKKCQGKQSVNMKVTSKKRQKGGCMSAGQSLSDGSCQKESETVPVAAADPGRVSSLKTGQSCQTDEANVECSLLASERCEPGTVNCEKVDMNKCLPLGSGDMSSELGTEAKPTQTFPYQKTTKQHTRTEQRTTDAKSLRRGRSGISKEIETNSHSMEDIVDQEDPKLARLMKLLCPLSKQEVSNWRKQQKGAKDNSVVQKTVGNNTKREVSSNMDRRLKVKDSLIPRQEIAEEKPAIQDLSDQQKTNIGSVEMGNELSKLEGDSCQIASESESVGGTNTMMTSIHLVDTEQGNIVERHHHDDQPCPGSEQIVSMSQSTQDKKQQSHSLSWMKFCDTVDDAENQSLNERQLRSYDPSVGESVCELREPVSQVPGRKSVKRKRLSNVVGSSKRQKRSEDEDIQAAHTDCLRDEQRGLNDVVCDSDDLPATNQSVQFSHEVQVVPVQADGCTLSLSARDKQEEHRGIIQQQKGSVAVTSRLECEGPVDTAVCLSSQSVLSVAAGMPSPPSSENTMFQPESFSKTSGSTEHDKVHGKDSKSRSGKKRQGIVTSARSLISSCLFTGSRVVNETDVVAVAQTEHQRTCDMHHSGLVKATRDLQTNTVLPSLPFREVVPEVTVVNGQKKKVKKKLEPLHPKRASQMRTQTHGQGTVRRSQSHVVKQVDCEEDSGATVVSISNHDNGRSKQQTGASLHYGKSATVDVEDASLSGKLGQSQVEGRGQKSDKRGKRKDVNALEHSKLVSLSDKHAEEVGTRDVQEGLDSDDDLPLTNVKRKVVGGHVQQSATDNQREQSGDEQKMDVLFADPTLTDIEKSVDNSKQAGGGVDIPITQKASIKRPRKGKKKTVKSKQKTKKNKKGESANTTGTFSRGDASLAKKDDREHPSASEWFSDELPPVSGEYKFNPIQPMRSLDMETRIDDCHQMSPARCQQLGVGENQDVDQPVAAVTDSREEGCVASRNMLELVDSVETSRGKKKTIESKESKKKKGTNTTKAVGRSDVSPAREDDREPSSASEWFSDEVQPVSGEHEFIPPQPMRSLDVTARIDDCHQMTLVSPVSCQQLRVGESEDVNQPVEAVTDSTEEGWVASENMPEVVDSMESLTNESERQISSEASTSLDIDKQQITLTGETEQGNEFSLSAVVEMEDDQSQPEENSDDFHWENTKARQETVTSEDHEELQIGSEAYLYVDVAKSPATISAQSLSDIVGSDEADGTTGYQDESDDDDRISLHADDDDLIEILPSKQEESLIVADSMETEQADIVVHIKEEPNDCPDECSADDPTLVSDVLPSIPSSPDTVIPVVNPSLPVVKEPSSPPSLSLPQNVVEASPIDKPVGLHQATDTHLAEPRAPEPIVPPASVPVGSVGFCFLVDHGFGTPQGMKLTYDEMCMLFDSHVNRWLYNHRVCKFQLLPKGCVRMRGKHGNQGVSACQLTHYSMEQLAEQLGWETILSVFLGESCTAMRTFRPNMNPPFSRDHFNPMMAVPQRPPKPLMSFHVEETHCGPLDVVERWTCLESQRQAEHMVNAEDYFRLLEAIGQSPDPNFKIGLECFNRLGDLGCQSGYEFDLMISILCCSQRHEQAYDMFKVMVEKKCVPSGKCILLLLKGLLANSDKIVELMDFVQRNKLLDARIASALVDFFYRCDNRGMYSDQLWSLVNEIEMGEIHLSVESYKHLVVMFCEIKSISGAVSVLKCDSQTPIVPFLDSQLLNSLINLALEQKIIDAVIFLFEPLSMSQRCSLTPETWTALFIALCDFNCSRHVEAARTLICHLAIPWTGNMYCSYICWLCRCNRALSAYELFNEMTHNTSVSVGETVSFQLLEFIVKSARQLTAAHDLAIAVLQRGVKLSSELVNDLLERCEKQKNFIALGDILLESVRAGVTVELSRCGELMDLLFVECFDNGRKVYMVLRRILREKSAQQENPALVLNFHRLLQYLKICVNLENPAWDAAAALYCDAVELSNESASLEACEPTIRHVLVSALVQDQNQSVSLFKKLLVLIKTYRQEDSGVNGDLQSYQLAENDQIAVSRIALELLSMCKHEKLWNEGYRILFCLHSHRMCYMKAVPFTSDGEEMSYCGIALLAVEICLQVQIPEKTEALRLVLESTGWAVPTDGHLEPKEKEERVRVLKRVAECALEVNRPALVLEILRKIVGEEDSQVQRLCCDVIAHGLDSNPCDVHTSLEAYNIAEQHMLCLEPATLSSLITKLVTSDRMPLARQVFSFGLSSGAFAAISNNDQPCRVSVPLDMSETVIEFAVERQLSLMAHHKMHRSEPLTIQVLVADNHSDAVSRVNNVLSTRMTPPLYADEYPTGSSVELVLTRESQTFWFSTHPDAAFRWSTTPAVLKSPSSVSQSGSLPFDLEGGRSTSWSPMHWGHRASSDDPFACHSRSLEGFSTGADTPSVGDCTELTLAKKEMLDKLKNDISACVCHHLTPYYKKRQIETIDDFRQLASKVTNQVFESERQIAKRTGQRAVFSDMGTQDVIHRISKVFKKHRVYRRKRPE